MPKSQEITKEQFQAFVDVQMGGSFNMFDPMAREATGLDSDTFSTIMTSYSSLSDLYPDVV